MSSLKKRRALSKPLFAIFLIGIVGITLFVIKMYFPPSDMGDNGSLDPPTLSSVTAGAEESTPPIEEVTSLDEAIDDLESLGCLIVNVSEPYGGGQGTLFVVDYIEFRKVAFNQKIVFVYSGFINPIHRISYFTTSFESIIVGCEIEEIIIPDDGSGDGQDEVPVEEPDSGFEKVEIQSAVCQNNGTFWTITMKLKNTGTATSTLLSAFINEVEIDNYDETGPVAGVWATNINQTVTTVITSGQTKTVYIWMDSAKPGTYLTSGTTINIKIHSSGGMDYIKLVELV